MIRKGAGLRPRISVVIPAHGEGRLIAEAVESVQEAEPVELVVVDDASNDADTSRVLAMLERKGTWILRHEANEGVASARMSGLLATSAPFVYPLDADDLAAPGVIGRMADLLERHPDAAACVGDVYEFGAHQLVRVTPPRLDPYRIAYTNEYPITALYRRSSILAVGGWRKLGLHHGYNDWDLWMSLAEHEAEIVHLGEIGYCRRLHGERLNQQAQRRHRDLYAFMRDNHPGLFARLSEHRRQSDLPRIKRRLYPIVYGSRTKVPLQHTLKPWFDRFGIWTRALPTGPPPSKPLTRRRAL
jgi:glycosyltransferase involved in cell wall biosynthesis